MTKLLAQAFAASQDELASLAREAIADQGCGRRHTMASNFK
jgi:hypothetical protein